MIKRCIFHIPNYIDLNRKSASNIRPFKMIKAFENIGYQVDCIMGYGKERKKSIKEIKKNIRNGVKYDFLYSESSTMPTLLTEKNHLPTYPFLDFNFFKFCKKHNIKIGLFYRDIHWKFKLYNVSVPFPKRNISKIFYRYDLLKYRQLVDVLYLASEHVKQYLPIKNIECNNYKIKSLPPGCEIKEIKVEDENKTTLKLFYVGGISEELYNFEKVLVAVNQIRDVELTICCREKEWEKIKVKYERYINENIKIVHITGEELEKFYNDVDVCIMVFKENPYMSMAMPMKLFEYISNRKPIIATTKTAAGDFVQENNIGWTIEYNEKSILDLLNNIQKDRNQIKEKVENFDKVIELNTWEERAKKVAKDLS